MRARNLRRSGWEAMRRFGYSNNDLARAQAVIEAEDSASDKLAKDGASLDVTSGHSGSVDSEGN
jgi:hypothetical protein